MDILSNLHLDLKAPLNDTNHYITLAKFRGIQINPL